VKTTYQKVIIVQDLMRRITIIGKLSLKVIIRISVQKVSSTVTKLEGSIQFFKNTGASLTYQGCQVGMHDPIG